jgi:hypothetical protein
MPARVVTILEWGGAVTSLKAARLEVFDGPVAGQVLMTGLNEAFKPRIVFPQVAKLLETLGVTPLYFGVLGVPIRGRAFTDEDERTAPKPVAIISDRSLARAFDAVRRIGVCGRGHSTDRCGSSGSARRLRGRGGRARRAGAYASCATWRLTTGSLTRPR